ncbi:hypothetical protein IU485_27675 [Nocardia cyriacigeorgica]|uniref:hypothetical protein n=1 Tax=Nocardia cyriacigeorgica TaxID=135487 RepID=UPI001894D400|nr:hypothetical protein [Nocardia cyriacigeorgica]MBF6085157.1 hypothetical protein [Nocardia cyriacigeorgica]
MRQAGRTRKGIPTDDPRYERCHEAPVLLNEKRAQGIVGIHTRIGCTDERCIRLRVARQYLASTDETFTEER